MHAREGPMSAESDFSALTDTVLVAIGAALDKSDADLDWTINDGVLTIDCADAGRLIVNRHAPSREIWVAARSGGFHFRALDGEWRDTRDAKELGDALSRLLLAQAGIAVDFPRLPAPL